MIDFQFFNLFSMFFEKVHALNDECFAVDVGSTYGVPFDFIEAPLNILEAGRLKLQ